MASRLDRLVKLLETGSTPLIRNTAAQQLGDVQKQHPDELFNLLARVVPYLRHKSWDVRTSAAKAVAHIVESTSLFEPNGDDEDIKLQVKDEVKEEDTHPTVPKDLENSLTLQTLNIYSILNHGTRLLASGSQETDDLVACQEPATQLEFKRRTALCRLGLRGENASEETRKVVKAMNLKPRSIDGSADPQSLPRLDTSDSALLDDDEIQSPAAFSAAPTPLLSAQPAGEQIGLSKRQLNQLKRKQKSDAKTQASKVRVVDLGTRRPSQPQSVSPAAEPFAVKSENDGTEKDDMFSLKRSNVDEGAKVVSDFKGVKDIAPEKSMLQTEGEETGLEWPFERLCEVMAADLLDLSWEIRHGAAMGLREVIRVHGAGAGRESGKIKAENDALNAAWGDDVACRLCCVLMLDRFGDYVSDNVVAPIRETVGQTLGALMAHLPPVKIRSIYDILHQMVLQTGLDVDNRIWEVCHGGMTGLRYLVAVRSDLLSDDSTIMDGVVEAVMRGLTDYDDDVRAVSAATLTPIAKQFVQLRPDALNSLMYIVWGCLSDLSDDLSASTGFVMDLLATLSGFPAVLEAMRQNAMKNEDQSFTNLVPRLYPFLRHTITSVRLAVLRALQTFLKIGETETRGWVSGHILRLVYQNLLVERNRTNLNLSLDVYMSLLQELAHSGNLAAALLPHAEDMLALALHPVGTSRNPLPMELHRLVKPSGQLYGPPVPESQRKNSDPSMKRRRRSKSERREDEQPHQTHNVDGHMIAGDVDLVGTETLIRSRTHAAKAIGSALARLPDGHERTALFNAITHALKSSHSTTQMWGSLIIEECARATEENLSAVQRFTVDLLAVLDIDRPGNYSDILSYLKIVRSQCQNLLNAFREHGHVSASKLPSIAVVVQGEPEAGPSAFAVDNAESLVGGDFDRLKKGLAPAARITSSKILADARNALVDAIDEFKTVKLERDTRIRAAAAGALIAIGEVPRKPTNLIKSIMDSIKLEENLELQKRSAFSIASLLDHYANAEKKGPANKIIGNLISFYCMDTSETPDYEVNASKTDTILSLHKEEDRKEYAQTASYEKEARAARVTRRGAKEALDRLCSRFGVDVFVKNPILASKIQDPLQQCFGDDDPMDNDGANELGQQAVDGLSVLRAVTPVLHEDLRSFIVNLMRSISKALRHKQAVYRYAAAKCFATICSILRIDAMKMLVEEVLPRAGVDDLYSRQGTIELIYHLIHVMEDNILPYVIFLIVPVLGRMSDSDNDIRLIATTTFATLVKLVPLEAGIPDPPGFPESLLKGRDRERKFISQMLDFKKVEPFELPVAIKAELRPYQQEGVNWLAFLNRYHLHGILCDDMGLGKTLQTLCIVASDHHMREEEYAKTKSLDTRRLPSLIVCPPTLSGHWQQEIIQFAPFLSCMAFVGPSSERGAMRDKLGTTDIVVTSYDICRNEIDLLAPIDWNYCVLDEGHLIKNPKAKTSMAVKRLKSNHRLILSGTPIQNNVLELWSLFDFLMPGFLGTEKVFADRFARPIANSRFAKSSSKEQEAGALAIEALHKQVLPFLLRRLKEEVLHDLPPKILQNYYCDLSDLQKKLFDEFAKKERKKVAEEAGSESKEAKQHIFQALQYMRKLCNSPALVVKPDHKQYGAIQTALEKRGSSLRDVAHAPKLNALKDLLLDCGIGADPSTTNTFVSPHRALIFCQMKEMLDIVATTVFRDLLPNVQYLRLDGSVEANKRQAIVNQFNTDPSFDCLLLTTSVGGLGLNLTGADTVIFVEHDWNPQKDMQAMDRAHRIGQKKVVNVYRLITRGTLEEKILNLQRFKIDVASTVVNQQNAGLATMETDQILDLFNISSSDPSSNSTGGSGGAGGTALPPPPSNSMDVDVNPGANKEEEMVDATTGQVREKGKKGWMDDLDELWDEKGYEEEFDLNGFLKSMKM